VRERSQAAIRWSSLTKRPLDSQRLLGNLTTVVHSGWQPAIASRPPAVAYTNRRGVFFYSFFWILLNFIF
jgi:hypothetical protein